MSQVIPEIGGEKPIKIPEKILTIAKESARRFGSVQPMLFVHGTKNKVYLALPFGETSDERVAIMTQVGIQLAKQNDIGDVERGEIEGNERAGTGNTYKGE